MNLSTRAVSIAAIVATLTACSGASGKLTPSPGIPMDAVGPHTGTKVALILLGTIPAGTAGKAFAKPVAIKVTAKDSKGNVITGAYSNPIKIVDSDTTGATVLKINGGALSANLKSSTDVLTLSYTGLAITPATFTASASQVKAVKGTFTPTLAGIVYTGSKVSALPEIDLYSTTQGTQGYKSTFTATQVGWTNTPYKQPFKYAFAAIGGQTNNCPGGGKPSYSITPASGAAGTSFTVQAVANSVAGECAMTITGGGGKTVKITLTFTTSSVGVN